MSFSKLLNNKFTLFVLTIIAIYLFIDAPPPLGTELKTGKLIPIESALRILNKENEIIRHLYTKEIVGHGKKQGLKFDENWEREEIHAGLLPAQFLRMTANYLQRSELPLGLFLGSNEAINKSNLFEGAQLRQYKEMLTDQKPKFSYIEDISRYSFMFPDVASVKPCISCHNKHKESPKTDWKIGDIMGATTWIYPDKTVTYDELITMISLLHKGAEYAYSQALLELGYFEGDFSIAHKWPREGKFIPSAEEFAKELRLRTAPITFSSIEQLNVPQNSSPTLVPTIELALEIK